MRRFTILKILICLILICTLTACSASDSFYHNEIKSDEKSDVTSKDSDDEEITDTHSDDGRSVVGISMPSRLLERWNRDGNYLKKNFEENGYEVILSFADDLIDNQIHDIEDMITNGTDLLIIAPVDGASLSHVLELAKQANVPVMAYDRLIMKSDAVDYYVSFDNYMVGALQGEYIEAALDLKHAGKKTYNLEITSGDTLDNNATYFYDGMYDVLSGYIDSGTLNIPSGQKTYFATATSSWSTELAQERFVGLLNSYYIDDTTLDAVACANDSTALGVTNAIESDYNKENTVIITGQDCDAANLKNIIDGKQSMAVYKALPNQTIVALTVGMSIMRGENPENKLITESNWDFSCVYDTSSYNNGVKDVKSYLLAPITITKDNYITELIDKGYYTIADDGYPVAVE